MGSSGTRWGHERVSLIRCSREITGQRTKRMLRTTAVVEYKDSGSPRHAERASRARGVCDPHAGGYSNIFILIIYLLLPLHVLSRIFLHLSSPVLHSVSIYPHISLLPLSTLLSPPSSTYPTISLMTTPTPL
jgi:hypothetical protein